MQHGTLLLCSLLAAASQFHVLIGLKMQLTSWCNGNEIWRNAIWMGTQTLIDWPYCPFVVTVCAVQFDHCNLAPYLSHWFKKGFDLVSFLSWVTKRLLCMNQNDSFNVPNIILGYLEYQVLEFLNIILRKHIANLIT